MPYLHIARGLAALDSTTKRLRIGDALANIFRAIMQLSPGAPAPARRLRQLAAAQSTKRLGACTAARSAARPCFKLRPPSLHVL